MKSNISTYFKTSDGWLLVLMFLVWIEPLLQQLYSVVKILPVLRVFADNIQDTILLLAGLMSLKAISKRLVLADLVFYVMILAIYLLQYIIYPENAQLLSSNAYVVLCTVAPLYFVGRTFNFKMCEQLLTLGSILMILYTLYMQVFYMSGFDTIGDHRMVAAYNLLPHLILFTYRLLNNRSILNFIFTLVGVCLIISLGNRGSLLCYLFFVISCVFILKEVRKQRLVVFTLGVLVLLIFINIKNIAIYMADLTTKVGLSSRIFELFLDENLLYRDDREYLVQILLNKLNNGGQLSYGLWGSYRFIGVYPHSIIVELWFSFGYVVGTLLFGIILVLNLIAFFSTRNDSEKAAYLMLVSIGFLPLFLSGTFLTHSMFFFFIGYCITLIRPRIIQK